MINLSQKVIRPLFMVASLCMLPSTLSVAYLIYHTEKKLELWQVKGEENKKALAEEKDRVRHKVEDFFKIKIDRPCQGGQGNYNNW